MGSEQPQSTVRPVRSLAASRGWDATKGTAPVELLQKGFELAYFIVPDRSSALDILVRALDKVRVRSHRELKRLYWRDKHSQRPVRRIARTDADMLQWLIMYESEQYERAQEDASMLSVDSMVIHYIKYLVQITTSLSSFYVNVGITRLLHDYSTSEAQHIYEMLTSRYLGPDEYRRAKSVLMDKIRARFTSFLRVARVDHGELRFEAFGDQRRWVDLASSCLQAFTPWSTLESCPHLARVNGSNKKLTSGYHFGGADQNENELRCCHLLIEPNCYEQLMEDLAFDAPATKLAMPRFVMPEKPQKSDDCNIQPPNVSRLSNEDLDEIQRRLATTDARRRNTNPRDATLVIDGIEYGRIDLAKERELQIGLEAGASLIEIRGKDDRGDVALATHLISYANNVFEFSRAAATLGNGNLKFEVTPIAVRGQDSPRAILTLKYHPRFRWTHLSTSLRELRTSTRTTWAFATAVVVAALIGWTVAGVFYSHRVEVLNRKLHEGPGNQQQSLPTAARAIVSYTLIPDEQRVRGAETSNIPEISLRLHTPAICLQLPLSQNQPQSPSYSAELKTFGDEQTMMTENFLRPTPTDRGSIVEIVVSTDLLRAGKYYTVHLHSADRTGHFTFKVVENQ